MIQAHSKSKSIFPQEGMAQDAQEEHYGKNAPWPSGIKNGDGKSISPLHAPSAANNQQQPPLLNATKVSRFVFQPTIKIIITIAFVTGTQYHYYYSVFMWIEIYRNPPGDIIQSMKCHSYVGKPLRYP